MARIKFQRTEWRNRRDAAFDGRWLVTEGQVALGCLSGMAGDRPRDVLEYFAPRAQHLFGVVEALAMVAGQCPDKKVQRLFANRRIKAL